MRGHLSRTRVQYRWTAHLRVWGAGLLVFLIYYAAARFHLRNAAPPDRLATIWLPAGIGLVALLSMGRRGLIPIALASAAVNWHLWLTGAPGLPAAQRGLHMLIAIALDVAEPWLAYAMWRRFVPDSIRDLEAAVRFVALVAIVPCVCTAPLKTLNLVWAGPWGGLPTAVLLAYSSAATMANILGVLLVTPLYQAWIEEEWPPHRELARIVVSLAVLVLVQFAAFRINPTFIYLTVPVMLLIALIAGARVATFATFLLVVTTVGATVAESGPFVGQTGNVTYVPLLVYLLVLVASSLVGRVPYSYLLRQRRELRQAVEARTVELRSEVAARTAAAEAALAGERRFRALIEKSHEGIALFDQHGRIMSVGASAISRSPQTDAPGFDVFADYLHPDDRQGTQAVFAQLLANPGTSFTHTMRVMSPAGAVVWIEGAATNLLDDPAVGAVVVNFRDVTERHLAWEALERERELLSQRVSERTAELLQANSDLQKAAKTKDEFLASMSHELRTPLNAILMLAELIEMEAAGPVTEQQRKHLQTLQNSGQHLLGLINDILDLSKIQAHKLEVECNPILVAELCHGSLSMVATQAERKRISITLSIDPEATLIQADDKRTKQILVNLLSNAVKFTPDEGRVGLKVDAQAAAGRLCFTVWDTGIGIAAAHIEHLFEPFVQLESTLARRYEGTGLGLPLALELARLQGGDIQVHSEPGKGSAFTLWLPWTPIAEGVSAASA